ncbi:MAG TPA: glycosyltransferase family A protein [Chthoniobacterales bacterium]
MAIPSTAGPDHSLQLGLLNAFQPLPFLSDLPKMVSDCKVTVTIPVKNEAQRLPQTLAALCHQIDLQGQPFGHRDYEVIVLANNCTDRSAEIVRGFGREHPTFQLHLVEADLPRKHACVGHARKWLMDEACRRQHSVGNLSAIIASTDGDTVVAPTWIAATLQEIRRGADAVGGRIQTDHSERAKLDGFTRACYLRQVAYGLLRLELESFLDPDPADPFPRHYYHNGASFAVTARVYLQAGGMPAVATSEDIALYHALLRAGANIRHSPLVQVHTSVRLAGRAVLGMADQLSAWHNLKDTGRAQFVEPVEAASVRLSCHRRLRLLLSKQGRRGGRKAGFPLRLLAAQLAVNLDWLTAQLEKQMPLGWLFHEVEAEQARLGDWRRRWPAVPIQQAVSDLRIRNAFLRHARAELQTAAWCGPGNLIQRPFSGRLAVCSGKLA